MPSLQSSLISASSRGKPKLFHICKVLRSVPHPLTLTTIPRRLEAEVLMGQMPFLSSNQQCQSTGGKLYAMEITPVISRHNMDKNISLGVVQKDKLYHKVSHRQTTDAPSALRERVPLDKVIWRASWSENCWIWSMYSACCCRSIFSSSCKPQCTPNQLPADKTFST